MNWVVDNWADISSSASQHVRIALVPLLVGLLISVPLGWACSRSVAVKAVVFPLSSLLYTIPSIALFVLVPGLIGTKTLDPVNVMIPLTFYTLALLIRSITEALMAIPTNVVAAATAIGYRPLRRFATVEFPLAVPAVIAGLRVAAVSNISLVTVGALIGVGGLGHFFKDGFQLNFLTPILVGVFGTLLLALIADVLLQLFGRWFTPWARVRR